jgi:putative transposase
MTPEQEVYFNRAAGIARQAWNTALDIYKSYKKDHLKADWNEIKKDYRRRIDTEFPWVREVTKCAPESAIRDLRQSISTYYKAKKTLAGNKAALKKLRFPSIRSRKKRSGGLALPMTSSIPMATRSTFLNLEW